jgi:outer membrane protein OmpA-like peptidoglycan-associated protein
MRTRSFVVTGVAAGMFLVGACTPIVPPELADARRAYDQASHGPAATVAPAELHKASDSLAKAEQAFTDDPRSQRTRDLAYVAGRKAESADAIGQAEMSRRQRHQAENDFVNLQSQIIGAQRSELSANQAQLTDAQRAAQLQAQQFATEQQARQSAEQRAKDAEDRLAKIANVKQEPRGTVITLSGSVLFASNQSTLLSDARARLDEVAAALLSNKERKIVIQGYTDSRGSDARNLELSRRRAEAVRNYIISAGYDPDLIVAEGMGEANPIANNASAEGRANNRRVEIVVKNKGD